MNSIKVKMQSMVDEKEYAKRRLEETETEAEEFNQKIKAAEEEHQSLLKKINQTDLEFDKMCEELSNNNTKLDEANKASATVLLILFIIFIMNIKVNTKILFLKSELEVGGLQRRINLTETELEQMESRLKEITTQLTTASQNSDKSEQ